MTPAAPPPPPSSAPLSTWIRYVENRLASADLCFDNGLQTPRWEAEYLLAHTADLPLETVEKGEGTIPSPAGAKKLLALLERRIGERLPLPYLTGKAFFAGLSFRIDPRALIPRSRIENVLDDDEGVAGLLEPGAQVTRILDLGTGSGCLAIALALAFPGAKVDAVDLSPDALELATANIRDHKLEKRVRPVLSNLFDGLGDARYDLIVTNPPYVPQATFDALPPEYRHEPGMALAAGADGLDLVRPLLEQAPDRLTPNGTLLCEVGDEVEAIMERRWPDLPVEWIMFHFGASGVFCARREWLAGWSPAPGPD